MLAGKAKLTRVTGPGTIDVAGSTEAADGCTDDADGSTGESSDEAEDGAEVVDMAIRS
jgi:hypothetical protein